MYRPYRNYWLGFVVLTGVCLTYLACASLLIGPPIGDLVRIALLAPRDFGWREPQQKVEARVAYADRYAQYSDVVILGDSFSRHDESRVGSWVDHFQARTGLSVLVLEWGVTEISEIVSSEAFKVAPPKLLIYQVVERALWPRLRVPGARCERSASANSMRIEAHPDNPTISWLSWDQMAGPINFNYAFRYSMRRVLSFILGADHPVLRFKRRPNTVERTLKSDRFFSNRKSTSILLLDEDNLKDAWPEQAIEDVRCGLYAVADQIEANGRTQFLFMAAPDKSSIYAPYIEGDVSVTRLAELQKHDDLSAVHILESLSETASRYRDVYLPGDTHWGWRGQKIAADAVIDHLRGRGALAFVRETSGHSPQP